MQLSGRDDGVRVGRVYDAPSPDDGRRVLVDRLWPRGVRKDDPRIDQWLRDVAPSTELRRWYGHEPSRFGEFAGRYAAELDGPAQAEAFRALRELAAAGAVTLLTATREPAISHAAVLARLLTEAHG
ncbi:DUF488 domain-containing protein [Terrabacter lapilli]|uniref:DUF488 domain-containing protein n=1 Tax=Terrabacter lapilli TaxID=436231 RepID=UPI0031DDD6A0